MKKFDVLNQISKAGVVAVVRGKNAEEAIKISDACIKGGVTSIELTYTVPGARRIIEDLVAKYADNKEVLIGAGSAGRRACRNKYSPHTDRSLPSPAPRGRSHTPR